MVGKKDVSRTLFVIATILIVIGTITSIGLEQPIVGITMIVIGLFSMMFSVMFNK